MKKRKEKKNKGWQRYRLEGKSNFMFMFGIIFALTVTREELGSLRWFALVFIFFAIIIDYMTKEK